MSLLPTLAFLGLLVLMAEGSGRRSLFHCGCSSHYRYVCGYNGQTYRNSCYAWCSGVSVQYQGSCRTSSYSGSYSGYRHGYGSGCNCGHVAYSPICSDNYVTYDNYCLAGCAGRSVLYVGKCRTAPAYPPSASRIASHGSYQAAPVYSSTYYKTPACDRQCVGYNGRYPVCCSNYRTYYNACQARCAGARIFYYGACNRQVYYYNQGQCGNCYRQARSFVCGRDGRTYYNQCSCDCASTDYSSYKKIGVSYKSYCSGFNYQSRYY